MLSWVLRMLTDDGFYKFDEQNTGLPQLWVQVHKQYKSVELPPGENI